MKKILSVFIFIPLSFLLSAQKDSITIYVIQFEKSINITGSSTPFKSLYNYNKYVELDKSTFNKSTLSTKNNNTEMSEDDDSILFYTISDKNNNLVYKDYNTNSFFAKHQISNRFFLVKESLDFFNWKLEDAKKQILGFSCQSATMEYRGRQFKAWFTADLPIGGPYKYDGLPGMILEIESTDGFIAFKAVGIKNTTILASEKDLQISFNLKDAMSWDDFSALYKIKALENINYRPNPNSQGIIISPCAIECYIDKDDKEYNEILALHKKKVSDYKK